MRTDQHGSPGAQNSRPQPRPYQRAANAAIHRELAKYRSTLIELPTGTGKTVVFADYAMEIAMAGERTLIVVHRDELRRQAQRKCEAVGLHVSVEQGKYRASLNAPVVIASVQSLRGERLRRFPRDHFARIVVDEAHHAVAPGYRSIFDHFSEARILGVTATPKRADGIGLGEVFETVAYRFELRDAIRDGWLVPITARRVVLDGVDLSGVKTRAGDLAQDELAEVMAQERAIRGVVEPLLDLVGARKTVVFGVDVAHAQAIAAELNRRRPGCARAVSGSTDDAEREQMLEAFERGEFQFLANCALLTEGWDCPSVECVAIARPTKSLGLFMQMVGRGTRLVGTTYAESCRNGKREMLLLAFGANAGKHRLVGPADVLQGDLDDDLRAELDRLFGYAPRRIEDAIAQATGAVQVQRVDLAAAAKVRWHVERVDPFIGEQTELAAVPSAWGEALATSAQLSSLRQFGIDTKELPARFSMADASRLIGRLAARAKAGLCSLKQARRLASYGLDPRAITFDRASQLFGILRTGDWNAIALVGQPEAGEEFQRRLQAAKQRKREEQRKKLGASSDETAGDSGGRDGAEPPARPPRVFRAVPSSALARDGGAS